MRRNYLDLYAGPACTCSVALCTLRLAVDLGVNKLHYPLVLQAFCHLACFVGSAKISVVVFASTATDIPINQNALFT